MTVSLSADAIGSFVGPGSHTFYVVALALEIAFFTANLVTFGLGTWIMFRAPAQKRWTTTNVILMTANTLMFVLSGAHLILDLIAAHEGFFHSAVGVEAAKFMIYVTQTLIGDGFLIYRLYRIFNCSWTVVIVPGFILLSDAAIGYASTFLGLTGFYMSVAFYALSIFINIICTVLIVWRVVYLSREFRVVSPRKTNRKVLKVIEATVQSTAIYTAAGVSLVITFANSTAIGYPTCLNLFPALIGLVFSFIAIRVALNTTRGARPDSQAHASSSHTGRTTIGSTSTAPMLSRHRHSLTIVALDGDKEDKYGKALSSAASSPDLRTPPPQYLRHCDSSVSFDLREHRRMQSDATSSTFAPPFPPESPRIFIEKEVVVEKHADSKDQELEEVPRLPFEAGPDTESGLGDAV